MRRGSVGVALLVLAAAASRAPVRAGPVDGKGEGTETALRKHVAFLAGSELKGRGAWEDRKRAADYVAEQFQAAGFLPLPGRASYLVDHGVGKVPGAPEQPEVRNVCAWWPAPPKTAAEAGEYVLLSAHYDHLGVKDGVVYPGADDNASGVAVLLETARAFTGREALVLREKALPRALCLVAFDLEEQQLVGSRRFVAEPPVPLAKCSLFLTMDQMGRSLADLAPGLLFLMGSEHCAWLERTAQQLPVAQGIEKQVLGIDFQPPTGYSDYVPFQEQKIPFLFVSTGACGHYHQPGDTPERLDYPRMAQHVDFMRELVTQAMGSDMPVTWRDPPEPTLQEIQTVKGLVERAIPKLDELEVPGAMRVMVTNFNAYLGKIVERGAVTATERTVVRNTARQLFQQAVMLTPR